MIKNNTHYFDHDYNAQNDPKVEKMLCEKGNSAYGVFWRIIEKLAQEPLHKLKTEYKILAYSFHETIEFVKSVVEDFGLFVIEEGFFWSDRLNKHFEKRQILSEKGRLGGLKRVANLKPPLKPPLADPSSILNKRKEKKIKEKEEIKKEGTASDADPKTQKLIQKYEILKNHEYFKNSDFSEKWDIFNQQKGKKATLNAKIMGLNTLFRFSLEESITALENSICSGWTGLFPKKGETKFSNGQKLSKIQRVDNMVNQAIEEVEQAKLNGDGVHVLGDLSWLQSDKKTAPKQIGTVGN